MSFLDRVKGAGFHEGSRVYELEPLIRSVGDGRECPRDGKAGAAYVDTLSGPDDVGRAEHMLSYSWGYTVGSIISALMAFCMSSSLDPRRVYVWICCLCINQHRVKDAEQRGEHVRFEEFRVAFSQRVRGVGHLLALMSPWHDPGYVRRVWCVYEFSVAMSERKALSILMPPAEEEAFRGDLFDGRLEQVYSTLANVKIQDADASVADDKVNILKSIDPSAADYDISQAVASLNRAVRERLQAWFVETAASYLEEQIRRSEAATPLQKHNVVGQLLTESAAAYGRARWILQQGLEQSPEPSVFAAESLRLLGRIDLREGDREAARDRYQQARHMLEACGGLETVQCARLLVDTAQRSSDLEAAKALFEQLGATAEPDYARALKHLATSKRSSGDLEGALEGYQQAHQAYVSCGAAHGPGYADLLSNIGECFWAAGDAQETVRWYRQARKVYDTAGIFSGAGLGRLCFVLAEAHLQLGSRNAAAEACRLAKAAYEDAGITGQGLYDAACELLSELAQADELGEQDAVRA